MPLLCSQAVISVLTSTRFLESDGQGTSINPWFWILCLFIGPIIVSICSEWFMFMSTRVLTCTEGLLTQLVFEHSLRIRFKAEVSKEDSPSSSQPASAIVTPDTQSVEGIPTLEGGSDTQSGITGSTKGKGKADSSATGHATVKDGKKEKKDNLVGTLTTLVTVDLDNIVAARDFLMVGKSPKIFNVAKIQLLIPDVLLGLQAPLELGLAIFFLHKILGWRYKDFSHIASNFHHW